MAREDFKLELLESAKRKARASNYQFDYTAEKQLREFINAGVERMSTTDYYSQERKLFAQQNIEKLVEHMVNNAKSRRIYDNIDTRAFSAVHFSICPLWPFC